MLYNICYYLASTGFVASAVFGVFLFIEPEKTKRAAFNLSFKGVQLYINITDCLDNIWKNFIDEEEEEEEGEEIYEDKEFLFIDNKNQLSLLVDEVSADTKEQLIRSKNFALAFVCWQENKYRRIEDAKLLEIDDYQWCKDDIIFNSIKSPFIQVELVQNGKTFDIHRNLKGFYFVGNMILDTAFLQWYMYNFHYGKLEDGYVCKIIDHDVEMFDLRARVHITITPDRYDKHMINQ